jgi:tetratricopeptide (TPR) repeat protein
MFTEAPSDPKNQMRVLKEQVARLLELNEVEAAVEISQRISMLDPSDGMERLRYGRLLVRLHRSHEAVDAFREAVGLFRHAGDYRRAQAACGLVLTISPEDSEIRLLREHLRRPQAFVAKARAVAKLDLQRQTKAAANDYLEFNDATQVDFRDKSLPLAD